LARARLNAPQSGRTLRRRREAHRTHPRHWYMRACSRACLDMYLACLDMYLNRHWYTPHYFARIRETAGQNLAASV
jgi:hypothetical protein